MKHNKRTVRTAAVVAVSAVMALSGIGAVAAAPVQFGLNGGVSSFDERPVGTAQATVAIGIGQNLDLEFAATAIHTLEREYKDNSGREYQAEIGWTSTGLRPFVSIGEHVELGLPLRTGMGVVQFRYNREYRDELRWTDEIIDRVDVAVNSIGVDLTVSLGDHWSLRGEGGFRGTSPLDTVVDVENAALSGWYGQIGGVYRLGEG